MRSPTVDNIGNTCGEQTLRSVGLWLKEARELKGETVENVANITRIGKNYLEAIEEGAAAKLPNPAYTRGFIRLYASHLGLSPDEALRMLNGQVADASQHTRREIPSTPAPPLPIRQQSTGAGRTRKLLFPLICAVALAVIVVTIVNRNSQKTSLPGSQPVTALQPPAETAPAATVTAPTLPRIDAPPAASPLQTGSGEVITEEGIVLRLKAVSSGRLHITIDGSVSQEYDLVAGDLVEWKAEKMFLLDLENASSVEGELDGKPLKPFGEAGKTAHLIIRKNGVQRD